jgi:hypothetical protein
MANPAAAAAVAQTPLSAAQVPGAALVETVSASAVVDPSEAGAVAQAAPSEAGAVAQAAPSATPVRATAAPLLPGPDQQVHRERLRHSITARARRPRARRRDPACQQQQRQREGQVRAEAAALASAWQEQGVPALEIADLLDCPPRTLRHWQHQCLAGCGQARPLGRP